MRIAAWNVNSIKVRLPHLLDWLVTQAPDAVCLQETKTEDAGFPEQALREVGYHTLHHGQKTYNGVAIVSRTEATDVQRGIPGYADSQSRVLAATVAGVRLVCVYVPNGESVESDKFRYKLEWLGSLNAWLGTELSRYPEVAVLGDYNIAPDARDVHDPAQWEGKVLCSEAEREAFRGLLALGLKDGFRLFDDGAGTYSWWDYRMNAFRRNLGLRIDHILVSTLLAQRARACAIDRSLRALERPSDHAPVYMDFTPR